MENREAIEYINWMRDKFITDKPLEACDLAISALEKQEQANTQNINSTHTSRPNTLELDKRRRKIMSDYIDRQVALDALGVTKNATKYGGDHSGYDTMMFYEIHDALTGIPAADVVPVVRCKDCKHFYFTDNRIPQEQRYVCEISGEIWKPDSFCSYGERKE